MIRIVEILIYVDFHCQKNVENNNESPLEHDDDDDDGDDSFFMERVHMGSCCNRLWLWYDIWIVDRRPNVSIGKTKMVCELC
uniref:PK-LRR-TM resistance protein n=1 Tax=Solanum tuberosum TaxID=4113 RepID=M1BFH5_SOLTU